MLLSNPEQIQRKNGTKVKTMPKIPAKTELTETMKLLLRKEMLLL